MELKDREAWGPGSFQMALPLVEAVGIRAGMRVLEVGGGSGQIAVTLAKHWDVTVFTLEPWFGGEHIQARAATAGVFDRVIALKLKAERPGFAEATFDAVISIGSFEMILDHRQAALAQMVRVAKPGARIGIAEPMCLPAPICTRPRRTRPRRQPALRGTLPHGRLERASVHRRRPVRHGAIPLSRSREVVARIRARQNGNRRRE